MSSSRSSSAARDIALIAVFAGIMAALMPLAIPTPTVPITLQSMGVILAGAILGGRRGGASIILFLALVALGLPLLAGGRGGLGVFVAPSVGYLVGYVILAFVVGFVTYRWKAPFPLVKALIFNIIASYIILYGCGAIGLMIVQGLSLKAALAANIPFLIGDAIKAILATVVAKGVHSAYPKLLPTRTSA